MDELKKKIKKFYIMFGIEAPAGFFLLVLFNHYIRKSLSDVSIYFGFLVAVILIAFYKYTELKKLSSELSKQEESDTEE